MYAVAAKHEQRGLNHQHLQEVGGGGAAGQLRASAREAVKGLTTYDGNPRVGVRTGARHEDGRYTDMVLVSESRDSTVAVVLLTQTKRW